MRCQQCCNGLWTEMPHRKVQHSLPLFSCTQYFGSRKLGNCRLKEPANEGRDDTSTPLSDIPQHDAAVKLTIRAVLWSAETDVALRRNALRVADEVIKSVSVETSLLAFANPSSCCLHLAPRFPPTQVCVWTFMPCSRFQYRHMSQTH